MAYDGAFAAITGENGSFTKDADLSAVSPIISFVGGNQSISTVGGFKTMVSNYSAYPSINKIIPTAIEDLPNSSSGTVWSHSVRIWNGVTEGYIHSRSFYGDPVTEYENYGIRMGSGSYARLSLYDFNSEPVDETISSKVIQGRGWVYDPSNPTQTNPSWEAFTFVGGWMPKTTDVITINFKMQMNVAGNNTRNSLKTNSIKYPFRVKVGSKYATCSMTSTTWSTVDHVNIWSINAANQISSAEGFGEWLDCSIVVFGIETAGNIEVMFGREYQGWNTNQVTPLQYGSDDWMFFKDFEIFLNAYEISDKDVEFKAESGLDFVNSKSVEINHSSRRENGCLDRGAFINANGEHETYFNRVSFPYSGSMGLTLAKDFSELQNPLSNLECYNQRHTTIEKYL